MSTNPRTEFDEHATRVRPGTPAPLAADERPDAGLRAARGRFGGLDLPATLVGMLAALPATLVGMLAALALLVLLGGMVGAAIGAIGYQTSLDNNHAGISAAGLAGGLIALVIAYFVGGWTAGRIARYDGARNGLMTGVWTIVLAALLSGLGAALGAKYNVFARAPNLPNWFSRDALTLGAVASAAVAALVTLAAGAAGGRRGTRYHEQIDSLIASTRAGGIAHGANPEIVRSR